MRAALSGAALFLSFGVVAVVFGVGTAAAADPVVDPEEMRAGVHLNNAETAALADGPLPALFTRVVPQSRIGAGVREDTDLYRDDNGRVHASLRQLIQESADRGGGVIIFVHVPGAPHGRVVDVYQH